MKIATISCLAVLIIALSAAADEPEQPAPNEQVKPWVEPVQFTEEDSCVDPMVKIRGKYEIGVDGLDGLVGLFKAADSNRDGRICYSEVMRDDPSRIVVWGTYDLNGDGCVTPAEGREMIQRHMVAAWEFDYRYMDGNRDGKVLMYELQNRFSQPLNNSLSPIEIMHEYDLNNDQAITQEEYIQRSIQIFHSMQTGNVALRNLKTKASTKDLGPRYMREGRDFSAPQ